jgi:hypothetical protein
MEERWNLERDDPEVAALLEAFLVNHVLETRNRFSKKEVLIKSNKSNDEKASNLFGNGG